MLTLLISLASADDAPGVRCTATWGGPTAGCPVDGWLAGEATRGTTGAAERAARRRLARLLELTAADLAERTALEDVDFLLCEDVAYNDIDVTCTEDAGTHDGDFCFITFDDRDCWDGTVFTAEGGLWRSTVEGRNRMCEAVDQALVDRNYTDVEEQRATCAERCLVETRVRCPAE